MDATALQSATGLSVDNAQAVGALTRRRSARRISGAGRYDGAEIRHWLVDWERPELRVLMFRGQLRGDPAVGRRLRGGAARAGRGAERAGRAVDPEDLRPGAGRRASAGSTRARPGSPARAWSRAARGASFRRAGSAGSPTGWFAHGTLRLAVGRAMPARRAAVKADRLGRAGGGPDALAGAGADGRGGRPVPGRRRAATSARNLPGEVRQPDQFPRVSAYPGRRLGDGLPQGWSDP